MEDLWAFNEEVLARAIFASKIPIVTGVGHEVDFTIADFVADHRAPTPSAAAEFISPDQSHWLQNLNRFQQRLTALIQTILQIKQQEFQILLKQLKHPREKIQQQYQQLDYLEQRLRVAISHLLSHYQQQFQSLVRTLETVSPLATLSRGYAIVQNQAGEVIRSTAQISLHEKLQIRLHQGKVACTVEKL